MDFKKDLAKELAETLAKIRTYEEIIGDKERYKKRHKFPLDEVLAVFDMAIMLKDEIETT